LTPIEAAPEEDCIVCGAPASECDGVCPLGDEDTPSDEFEETNCLALVRWLRAAAESTFVASWIERARQARP
jgi:hypothetical protein